ncbi:diguanylate cyclase [Ideonella sp. YS5]|uniref:GGDEF domain-containing protein n=1 Tax=Ideonella sp. YS5 TaxID=3453714 RepID=UPI003EEC4200
MPTARLSGFLRQAHRAWNLLHVDSAQARALAERATEGACRNADTTAEGWARLALGFHMLFYATAAEAAVELRRAQACFDAVGDRPGYLLAGAGLARSLWRQGQVQQALQLVLPLRDEGVRVLRHEQLGVLLNAVAGCYSAQGDSAQAFAYMFEALRHAGPRGGRGFDTVLHCNLSHELLQIGDYEHALMHVEQGLSRVAALKNPRLQSVLCINRVIGLTELGRAVDSLPDVEALLALPADPSGRGRMAAHFETLAIAALRAGRTGLGAELVQRAWTQGEALLPDERLERVTATGLLAHMQGRQDDALAALLPSADQVIDDAGSPCSVRMRAQFFGVLSEVQAAAGQPAAALAALRQCQRLQRMQTQMASLARYQAAALQTELLRLQHRLDENDAHRRSLERARAELAAMNVELTRQVQQVRALQEALLQQATQDPLTGLFNRRHLNDALPTLFALAQRESQTMALAIIDLDHFKRVNDQYGHAAGDRLLATFGELLADQCRRSDVACRYGGEEFCLLMPRTDAAGARRKVHVLLRRWRAQSFDIGDGITLQGLSFSAGVADTSLDPASPDALLKAADDKLLEAKREGRNRVGIAA